ncbi:MAG TPA: DNA polymerase [Blastocatellia bacterium]|nr:DNA polymerase [Blastocatellia bacterium]
MAETAYTLIEDATSLQQACREIGGHRLVAVDTETTSLDPYDGRVRLLQLSTTDGNYVIDLFQINALDSAGLRELLTSPAHIKVLHNAKFDLKMLLYHFGIEVGPIFDTFLASKLIAAGRPDLGHGLAAISARILDEYVDKSMQTSWWGGRLTEEQYRYAARDSEILLPLREQLTSQLVELGMVEVAKLEFDCVLPLSAMELAGMAIDTECWRRQTATVLRAHEIISSELKQQLAAGIEQLSLFGEPDINLDSPTQIIDTLGRMGIQVEGTRSWQLQPLAKDHPVIAKLLEYRTVQKALSSYGDSMLEHLNPKTGRLHPDFHQIGATGGRMSCSNPNLQQVPNTPEYRSCFRAPQGRKLVIADYSQIELRIIADWSEDTRLVKALMSGEDLHSVTASQMLGVPLGEVSKEQRAMAKQLNYGLIYGLGPQGLSARINVTIEEAEALIRTYFATYSGVAAWLKEAADRAITDRENRTRSGRLITFSFDPLDRAQVAGMERLGKNAPIQGSCADIIKRALILLHEALRPLDAQIVNCIHDEIVVEVAEAEADHCRSIVEREMMAAAREFIRSVPASVDIVIADAWLK